MHEHRLFSPDLTVHNVEAFQDSLAIMVRNGLRNKIGASGSHLHADIDRIFEYACGSRRLILHPDIFFWIQEGKRSASPDTQRLKDLQDALANVQRSYEAMQQGKRRLGLFIDLDSAEQTFGKRRLQKAERAAAEAGSDDVQFSLVPHDFPLLQAALAILQNCCPAFLTELETFVTHIHLFEGQAIIGFTDFENHGSIFLKYRLFRDQPIRMAEEIIHEAGHTILNTIMAKDRLILNNREERYSSPLRRDPRPMFGLIHQLFVLSRLHKFYRSLHAQHTEIAAIHLAKINPQIQSAFETVGQHARFTALGQQLFHELAAHYQMDHVA
jgi:hypothetical protein